MSQNKAKPKRVFTVIDNPTEDERAPFALVDPDGDTIVQLGATPQHLAAHAWDNLGADEVSFDGDVLLADHYRRYHGAE